MLKDVHLKTVLLFALIVLPSIAYSDGLYNSNGYNLNATASHFGTNLKISGRVNSGNPCRNLMVAANARSDDGKVVYLETPQFNYPGGGISLLFDTKALTVDRLKKGWKVTAVDAFCEGRPR
jgi:hypothetical protein